MRFRGTDAPDDDSLFTSWKDEIGLQQGQLKFFGMSYRMSMVAEPGFNTQASMFSLFNETLKGVNDGAPAALGDLIQASNAWVGYAGAYEML